MPKLIWLSHSPFKIGDGYGYASDNIYSRLKICNSFESERPGLAKDLPPGVGYQMVYSDNKNVVVDNGLPTDYAKAGNYKIGFSYWETDRVPSSWIPHMRDMDEIWTTSQFVYDVFKECNVNKNILKFNLGFNHLVFTKVKDIVDRPFTFLSMGAPSTRKNSQIAVDAFLKVRTKYNNIRLIYKTSGPPDARLRYGQDVQAIYGIEYIDVIEGIVDEHDLASIYRRSDCLIYPTSGEGWGMIPFQSIAMGIPTICTNATACTEYASLSIPLDYTWSPVTMGGIYSGTGNWAEPSLDDLCDKMIYVIENYEKEKQRALEASDYLHANYKWDDVVKDYKDRICQVLKK